MEWTTKLATGIEEIDNQHRELFSIINRFKETFSDNSKDTDQSVGQILRYLVEYSSFHFASEEDYMERIGYSGFSDHRAIHQKFIKDIKEILVKLKTKGSYRPIQLYYFLNDWLENHIGEEDQLYVQFKGKKVPQMVSLEKVEDVESVVIANLKRFDYMKANNVINQQKMEERRLSYLKSHYKGYSMRTNEEKELLKESLLFLLHKKIIEESEMELMNIFINEHGL
jgi:hemerythrin